ncbi:hypothetical protein ACFLVN_03660 [Chloroflexota bacterium]
MKDFAGDPKFPTWLIGDSPPEKWADRLDTPLDPRHPARHSIWTSVADSMQDKLYRDGNRRLDTSEPYIRNASDKPFVRPYVLIGMVMATVYEKRKMKLESQTISNAKQEE